MSEGAARFARRAAHAVQRRARPRLDRAGQAARRAAFVARTQAAAQWANAELELSVAPDVRIGPRVRVSFVPGTVNRLHLGPGVALEDAVVIRMNGGSVEMAERVRLRSGAICNIGGGRLTLGPDVVLSWAVTIHCAEAVTLAEMVGVAEQVTIADTNHYFTTPDAYFWHNARTKPVSIGRNTWLCPKVMVSPGARIGSHCIVAPNSVVVGEVPDGSLASGNPATPRPLDLPWRPAAGGGQTTASN